MIKNETQDKQGIKTQRVKQYFIQATKKIILEEGVESVSVRKVADQAGYSFTTIYNYFTDMNDLLHEVKTSMIHDVILHMQDIIPNNTYDLDDIKTINRCYIEYFVERPHIFRFFYSYRLLPTNDDPIEMPDYSYIYKNTYQGFVNAGAIKESEVAILAKTVIYVLHGLLALYFSDNGMTEALLYREVDQVVDFLLKGRNTIC